MLSWWSIFWGLLEQRKKLREDWKSAIKREREREQLKQRLLIFTYCWFKIIFCSTHSRLKYISTWVQATGTESENFFELMWSGEKAGLKKFFFLMFWVFKLALAQVPSSKTIFIPISEMTTFLKEKTITGTTWLNMKFWVKVYCLCVIAFCWVIRAPFYKKDYIKITSFQLWILLCKLSWIMSPNWER